MHTGQASFAVSFCWRRQEEACSTPSPHSQECYPDSLGHTKEGALLCGIKRGYTFQGTANLLLESLYR